MKIETLHQLEKFEKAFSNLPKVIAELKTAKSHLEEAKSEVARLQALGICEADLHFPYYTPEKFSELMREFLNHTFAIKNGESEVHRLTNRIQSLDIWVCEFIPSGTWFLVGEEFLGIHENTKEVFIVSMQAEFPDLGGNDGD